QRQFRRSGSVRRLIVGSSLTDGNPDRFRVADSVERNGFWSRARLQLGGVSAQILANFGFHSFDLREKPVRRQVAKPLAKEKWTLRDPQTAACFFVGPFEFERHFEREAQ